MNFENKSIIVTGGARGIGLAIVNAFAAAGADIVIGDLRCEDAKTAARNYSESFQRRVIPVQCDVGGVATQRGMVKALEDRLDVKVDVPADCEYVCALGAALLGLKRLQSRN
jgi:3-oxoacyl-[acyl-carrier protein] reductase